MTSMSQSGQRFSIFKTPEEKAKRRWSSNDPFFTRSLRSAHLIESSTGDKSTRYSISYLPGVSEHFINTGKTLEEAQLKVVLFACEIERLNTQNYALVKETEVLRMQMNKSQREKDLETKLAILLAQNEKLNQIVEEQKQLNQIEDLKAGQGQAENLLRKVDLVTQENDKLNTLLRQKLQEVENLRKQKDEFQTMNSRFEQLNIRAKNLLNQNTELNNMGAEKQNEVDKLKQRLKQMEGHEKLVNQLKEEIILIMQEKEKLNNMFMERAKDVELLKSQASKVKSLNEENQSGFQSKELMEENQRLNYLVTEKMKENQELREKLSELHSIMVVNEDLQNKIQLTRRENEMLNKTVFEKAKEIDQLKVRISETLNSPAIPNDWKSKFALVCCENERLNSLLNRSLVKTDTLNAPAEEIKIKITLTSQGDEKLIIDDDRGKQTFEDTDRSAFDRDRGMEEETY